jgi:hypothetical protein
LDVYSDFPKDKLQDALNKLQEKENLLLAQLQGRIYCFFQFFLSNLLLYCRLFR